MTGESATLKSVKRRLFVSRFRLEMLPRGRRRSGRGCPTGAKFGGGRKPGRKAWRCEPPCDNRDRWLDGFEQRLLTDFVVHCARCRRLVSMGPGHW